jgi:hypothetical protein
MKESEATNGTKLHALITSMLVRTSFRTTLSKIEGQAGEAWDDVAASLMRRTQELALQSLPGRGFQSRPGPGKGPSKPAKPG